MQDKYEFRAEVKKLLDILSKSLYQHKEIFLRELISNASDALKKMHFISLQNKDIANPDLPLEVEIIINSDQKTITIRDSGLGMTKQELIDDLGTIGFSGTERFIKAIKETQENKEKIDLDVIGQFGIGFYSVYMVAEKVKVLSKSYKKEETAHQWESEGTGDYTITPAEKDTRGTDVVVYLKEDEKEYLSRSQLEEIIKKYSNFVSYPIYITEIKPEEPKEGKADKGEEEVKEVEEKEETKEKTKETEEKIEKEEKEAPPERKPVNELQPLWKKPANEIKDEEYRNFYHFISNRYDDYSHVVNYAVDGQVQFRSIYYLPKSRWRDLMYPDIEYGLTLFSKNVMILRDCKDLIPQWMRFVKGMVETEDVPLNISRETIQNNRVVRKINDLIVKKFLLELNTMAEQDPKKFKDFWDEFGIFIKEGLVSDQKYKDKLLKLLRFHTTKTKDDETKGFDDYVKGMAADQKEIYYLIGENLNTLKLSPHLGYYNKNNLEVVLFSEPIDNYLMMNLQEYHTTITEGDKTEEKSFKLTPIDVSEEKAQKSEKEEKEQKEKVEEKKPELPEDQKKFLEQVKSILAEKIIDATMSARLYDSACRLANPADGMSSSFQRVMRYWTQNREGKEFQLPRKILEFNPDHPIVQALIKLYDQDPNNGKIKPVVKQLFDVCLLADGDLPDPSTMVPRLNQLIEMLVTGRDNVKNPLEEDQTKKDQGETS